MHLYPFTAATIARPIPVLPAVPSTIVPPGFSAPTCSASCTMYMAVRSLRERPGFVNSHLP